MKSSTYNVQLGSSENLTLKALTAWYQGPSPPPRERRAEHDMRPTDQESGVLDDAELLGPLPQPLLAPQEGTDAGITHQLDAGFGRGPLVGGRLALAAFLLIIGLVGAAHGLSILIEGHVIWLSLFIVTLWRLDLWDAELFPFWNLWYEQIKQTFSDMTHRQQHGINPLGGRKGKFRRK